jgi:hypothetical protein
MTDQDASAGDALARAEVEAAAEAEAAAGAGGGAATAEGAAAPDGLTSADYSTAFSPRNLAVGLAVVAGLVAFAARRRRARREDR